MKKFTVVLLRPDYLCADVPYGQETYTAFVEAVHAHAAVGKAQHEAWRADTANKLNPQSSDDYALCILFKGHHQPTLFGWQL